MATSEFVADRTSKEIHVEAKRQQEESEEDRKQELCAGGGSQAPSQNAPTGHTCDCACDKRTDRSKIVVDAGANESEHGRREEKRHENLPVDLGRSNIGVGWFFGMEAKFRRLILGIHNPDAVRQ